VVLVGTTASGKSDVAFALARARPGVEIFSVDSMSVYREMDIATAKPSVQQRAEVPHHLIDLADPDEEFTVSMFQRAARDAMGDVEGRGCTALLVGGTGLYVRSVVDDLALPGRWPEVAAGLEAEADGPGGCASPPGTGAGSSGRSRSRSVRDARSRPSARAWTPIRRPGSSSSGSRLTPQRSTAGSRSVSPGGWTPVS
jgi:hypothetical protein